MKSADEKSSACCWLADGWRKSSRFEDNFVVTSEDKAQGPKRFVKSASRIDKKTNPGIRLSFVHRKTQVNLEPPMSKCTSSPRWLIFLGTPCRTPRRPRACPTPSAWPPPSSCRPSTPCAWPWAPWRSAASGRSAGWTSWRGRACSSGAPGANCTGQGENMEGVHRLERACKTWAMKSCLTELNTWPAFCFITAKRHTWMEGVLKKPLKLWEKPYGTLAIT